jgi:TetR/AcrR family fatty acid metabolism transcriptional regulator
LRHQFSQQAIESRNRLLQASIYEFSHKGYDRAKVSDIVARAGFTQRVFYIYFKSKEVLYNELIDTWKYRAAAILPGSENAPREILPQDYLQVIQKRWEDILIFMAEDPDLTRAAYFLSPKKEETRQFFLDAMRRSIQQEQANGNIRSDLSADILAESIFSTLEGLALRYVLTGRLTPRSAAAQLTELYINGTKPNV